MLERTHQRLLPTYIIILPFHTLLQISQHSLAEILQIDPSPQVRIPTREARSRAAPARAPTPAETESDIPPHGVSDPAASSVLSGLNQLPVGGPPRAESNHQNTGV